MKPVNDTDVDFYTCHECSKREKWNDNWGWCYEVFGKGYAGYEIARYFCSEGCHNNWRNNKKKNKRLTTPEK